MNFTNKLIEDYDTSTEAGKLKDMLQAIVNNDGYDHIQFIVKELGYDLADFDIVDEERLNARIEVEITTHNAPYYDESYNNLQKELDESLADSDGLAEYGIKFEGEYEIYPADEDNDDWNEDKVGNGEIYLCAHFKGTVKDVESFIREIAGSGDSDYFMHMAGMASGEALDDLYNRRRYRDFYEAAENWFEYEDRYGDYTFEVYFQ